MGRVTGGGKRAEKKLKPPSVGGLSSAAEDVFDAALPDASGRLHLGLFENQGTLFGVLIIRILLFKVLY